MNSPAEPKPGHGPTVPRWPWWEPYLFTACLLAAFAAFLILCGFAGRIPHLDHALMALTTLAAVVEVFRRPSSLPSLAGSIALLAFASLAAVAYASLNQPWIAYGYAVQAVIWLGLSASAAVRRRRAASAKSARLDRAVETLRRAVEGSEAPSDDD